MAIVWSFSTAFYIFIWEILQASLVAQMLNNLPAMWEMCVQSLGWEDPMEKELDTQYSCLENSMERGAWQATVHGVAELDTMSDQHIQHDWIQKRKGKCGEM